MEAEQKTKPVNWLLEAARTLYAFVVALVLFLFFTLLLDVFCLLAFGGWNALLGKWPIFSGTVNSAFYSPVPHVISLMLGLAVISRIVLGNRVPYLLGMLFVREAKEDRTDDI